jgi:hypothetical protein
LVANKPKRVQPFPGLGRGSNPAMRLVISRAKSPFCPERIVVPDLSSCERKVRVVFLFLKPVGLSWFAADLGSHHHRSAISVWRFSVTDLFAEWLALNSERRNIQPAERWDNRPAQLVDS